MGYERHRKETYNAYQCAISSPNVPHIVHIHQEKFGPIHKKFVMRFLVSPVCPHVFNNRKYDRNGIESEQSSTTKELVAIPDPDFEELVIGRNS
jgi:predicted HD phosphohydrolase